MQTFVKILLKFDKILRRFRGRTAPQGAPVAIQWARCSRDTLHRSTRGSTRAFGPPGERRAGPGASTRAQTDGWATTQWLFPELVLGWIDAGFRAQIRIFQHFSRSSRKSSARKQICKIFVKSRHKKNLEFSKILKNFWTISENLQNQCCKNCRFLQNFSIL